ncbi:MAG: alpha/beta hydrolase [Ardenticatenaceae bacterium]|nr:alpha/beta hydrolase [Ardenticatenaceae bacterium]MCB8947783.1 alpha/beta hydrolase [Ardenticatenaceae bacterium]
MSITTIDSQLIHYEVLGRGQPLIFIHGWVGSWRYWWPSMQALSAHYRTFAFDLWGYGDSSKTPDYYSLNAYVNMVDQFIDKLGVARPVILVGHGLGAVVALNYTAKNPENVAKLATISLPVSGAHLTNKLQGADTDSMVSRVLGRSESFAEIDSEIRKVDTIAVSKSMDEIGKMDFVSEITNLNRPLLLVYGRQDNLVVQPNGEYSYLQQSVNDRFYVELELCHHFPMLQEKAKFNRLLLDFIIASAELTELTPKEYWQRRIR